MFTVDDFYRDDMQDRVADLIIELMKDVDDLPDDTQDRVEALLAKLGWLESYKTNDDLRWHINQTVERCAVLIMDDREQAGSPTT